MKMQHAFYVTLIFINRNINFPCVRYNNRKTWTMIPHLRYYCGIGTPVHELINDNWLIFDSMTWHV